MLTSDVMPQGRAYDSQPRIHTKKQCSGPSFANLEKTNACTKFNQNDTKSAPKLNLNEKLQDKLLQN